MLRRLAYVIAATLVLLGLLAPTTLLADADCSYCPRLGVRCTDGSSNFSNAEGHLLFDPYNNSLFLRLDFLNVPCPEPVQMEDVTNGNLYLTCDDPSAGTITYSSNFQGATNPIGWNFTTEFPHVFFDATGDIQSCGNPRVENLTFDYQGQFYNCSAGFLSPFTP